MNTALALDTLDDRRELHTLLARLAPARRVAFLAWACSRATLPGTTAAHPLLSPVFAKMVAEARRCDRADDRLTTSCYIDLIQLSAAYTFDLAAAAVELEKWARGRVSPSSANRRRLPAPPASWRRTS